MMLFELFRLLKFKKKNSTFCYIYFYFFSPEIYYG